LIAELSNAALHPKVAATDCADWMTPSIRKWIHWCAEFHETLYILPVASTSSFPWTFSLWSWARTMSELVTLLYLSKGTRGSKTLKELSSSHTFEGPSPPGYNLACSRTAISCRTCEIYLIVVSKRW